MQIKAILFDFDGTLANTVDLIIATFEHTCRTMLGTVGIGPNLWVGLLHECGLT